MPTSPTAAAPASVPPDAATPAPPPVALRRGGLTQE